LAFVVASERARGWRGVQRTRRKREREKEREGEGGRERESGKKRKKTEGGGHANFLGEEKLDYEI